MIYLDNNASTPIDPAVREAMLPFLSDVHANPSSGHALGRRVREAVEQARGQVAGLIGAEAEEIIFTSGGTESNNQLIKGVAHSRGDRGSHIIISAVEHPAVTNPCRFLEQQGYDITVVGVNAHGQVDAAAVLDAIRDDTILISIMLANNEVGTLQPVETIAAAARQRGVLVHTDAAQAVAKIPVRVHDFEAGALGVDALSIAGHKVYAPQGVGALYLRKGVEVESLLHGAGHEGGRRAGTENVTGIVGLGAACVRAAESLDQERTAGLRDRLYDGLKASLGEEVVLLGHPEERLPNTLAVAFTGRIGSEILDACPELCASTGAACHSGGPKRSAVLAAMDVPERIAFGAVRLSVGRFTTEAEIGTAVEQLCTAAARCRQASG